MRHLTSRYTNSITHPILLFLPRYGAVVRSANAYVPPGARRGPSGALPPVKEGAPSNATAPKPDIPKLAVNAPDGSNVAVANAASPATKVHYIFFLFVMTIFPMLCFLLTS